MRISIRWSFGLMAVAIIALVVAFKIVHVEGSAIAALVIAFGAGIAASDSFTVRIQHYEEDENEE